MTTFFPRPSIAPQAIRASSFTPYEALPSNIPLDTLTLSTSSNTPKLQAAWQKVSAKIFTRPQKPDSVNPALLNRAIWYGTKGFATPYPGDKKVLMPNQVPLQQHDDQPAATARWRA